MTEDSPKEAVVFNCDCVPGAVGVEKLKPVLADEAELIVVPKLGIEKGAADEAAVVA